MCRSNGILQRNYFRLPGTFGIGPKRIAVSICRLRVKYDMIKFYKLVIVSLFTFQGGGLEDENKRFRWSVLEIKRCCCIKKLV
jgi:hypothetical protein